MLHPYLVVSTAVCFESIFPTVQRRGILSPTLIPPNVNPMPFDPDPPAGFDVPIIFHAGVTTRLAAGVPSPMIFEYCIYRASNWIILHFDDVSPTVPLALQRYTA